MSLIQRRRALLPSQTEALDTTPIAAQYDVGYNNNGEIVQKSGYCITEKYKIPWEKGMIYRINNGAPGNANTYQAAFTNTPDHFGTTYSRGDPTYGITVSYAFENLWFSATLYTENISEAYLYEVRSGLVVFAGKGSPYYGKKNIND